MPTAPEPKQPAQGLHLALIGFQPPSASHNGDSRDMNETTKIKAEVDRIVELGAEVEAPGHAAVDESTLEKARAVLHQWVDGIGGVVVNPALGRVTVIDRNGYAASIASADLAFRMSAAGVTKATG